MSDNHDAANAEERDLIDRLAALRGEDAEALAGRLGGETTATVAHAIREYLATCSSGTRRGYRTHLRRFRDGIAPICDQFCAPCLEVEGLDDFVCRCDCKKCAESRIELAPQGGREISADSLSVAHARTVARGARRIALKRAHVRDSKHAQQGREIRRHDGRGAEETAVSAMRSFFAANGHPLATEGAGALKKPKRRRGQRRALLEFELIELCNTTETGGNDPELDSLIVGYGIATGARRQGAYTLSVGQLRLAEQIIIMNDKGDYDDAAPVAANLIEALAEHAVTRGGTRCDPNSPEYDPHAPVFWKPARQNGVTYTPLTPRRFDTLHQRWQSSHEWADTEQVGYHHLRHTVAERLKAGWGQHVAQRYLRHADDQVTDIYGRCTTAELARAMGELLGFEHPLVTGEAARREAAVRRLGLTD